MERTKAPKKPNLPDAINLSPQSQDFTMIPNSLIRDPNISAKAKAILCLLLANKDGWHTYISGLEKMMKEKRDAILSGIRELEDHGFVLRLKYRDKRTKSFRGTLWAYTNTKGHFSIAPHMDTMKRLGLELAQVDPQPGFPAPGNPALGNPAPGNPEQIISKEKDQREKDQKTSTGVLNLKIPESPHQKITRTQFSQFWEIYPRKIDKGKTLTAWDKICDRSNEDPKKPTLREILKAIHAQKKTHRWQRGFIPYSATWLNQLRWLDDPSTMNEDSSHSQNGTPKSKNRSRYYSPEKPSYGNPDKIFQS
jgi:hypothetical protein